MVCGRGDDGEWYGGSGVEKVRTGDQFTDCSEDWLDPDNNGVRIRYTADTPSEKALETYYPDNGTSWKPFPSHNYEMQRCTLF